MKKTARLAILSVVATLSASAALAGTFPKCMKDSKAIEETMNTKAQELREETAGKAVVYLMNEQFSMNSEGAIALFVDGFVKPTTDTFRLVPGIGLTAESRSGTMVYFCISIDGTNPRNEVIMHALEGPGLFSRKYATRPIRIRWRALSDSDFLLAGLFKTIGLEKIEKPVTKQIESLFYRILDPFFGTGMTRIQITPNEVLLWNSVVLGGQAVASAPTKVRYKSKWLLWDLSD